MNLLPGPLAVGAYVTQAQAAVESNGHLHAAELTAVAKARKWAV